MVTKFRMQLLQKLLGTDLKRREEDVGKRTAKTKVEGRRDGRIIVFITTKNWLEEAGEKRPPHLGGKRCRRRSRQKKKKKLPSFSSRPFHLNSYSINSTIQIINVLSRYLVQKVEKSYISSPRSSVHSNVSLYVKSIDCALILQCLGLRPKFVSIAAKMQRSVHWERSGSFYEGFLLPWKLLLRQARKFAVNFPWESWNTYLLYSKHFWYLLSLLSLFPPL